MAILLDVLLPVFFVIGAGYLSVMLRLYSGNLIDNLLKFTQTFAIPVLLFKGMSELDLAQSFDPALLASFYTGAFLSFLTGLLGAHYMFGRDWESSVAIGFCCLFSNSLMLGLSITERAYGSNALEANFAIVTIHAPFCYCIGITAMEIVKSQQKSFFGILKNVLSAMFQNAIILGILAGFLVNIFNIPIHKSVSDAVTMISSAALTLALFSMGGVLFRYRPSGDFTIIAMICVISLVLHPSLVWMFATQASLNTEAFRSAVLTSAMAPGINCYIFASMYGKATRIAASTVLISTALCLFTVWGWLGVLP